LGIEVGDLSDNEAVAQEQEVDSSIFGNLNSHFESGSAAFAYLIMILLYTPCVAAMGAYVREFGKKYSYFIAAWTMGLAYGCAAIFYQAANLASHPLSSISWIVAIVAVYYTVFQMLKRAGRKQQVLEVQVA